MGQRRIVAIDDNITNLKLLEKLLEEKYTMVCFQDALDALVYVQNNDADLILSDLMMPNMTGLQLLQEIHIRNIYIPFIIISAYDNKTYKQDAYSKGVIKYIVKPINPEELFDVVEDSLTLNPKE